MGSKRGKLEVIYDILKAIQDKDGKIKRTHVLYKANLSHQMLEEYLGDLLSKGFVVEKMNKKTRVYSLTDKGHEFVNKYQMVSGFVDFFCLD